jgi:hypothetical protein
MYMFPTSTDVLSPLRQRGRRWDAFPGFRGVGARLKKLVATEKTQHLIVLHFFSRSSPESLGLSRLRRGICRNHTHKGETKAIESVKAL